MIRYNKFNWKVVKIPRELIRLLRNSDGGAKALEYLKENYAPSQIITTEGSPKKQIIWCNSGLYLMRTARYFEAIRIFSGLYEHMLNWQKQSNLWTHKGHPLVWISECYANLGYIVHAKRYLMLTFVEDAIREKGKITPNSSGVHFRLVWKFGMSENEVEKYADSIYKKFTQLQSKDPSLSLYPEHVLQSLDNYWNFEAPSPKENYYYSINPLYVRDLITRIGDGTGKSLEIIAAYLLQCIPGCRTTTRQKQFKGTTDYDVVCSMDGAYSDFRSELGRYFLCECKDWGSKADFTTMAKFCRVLASTKCTFGILFSKNGITGEGKGLHANREQKKVFQDSGTIIIVLSLKDIRQITKGFNLLNLIRNRCEAIRLDL